MHFSSLVVAIVSVLLAANVPAAERSAATSLLTNGDFARDGGKGWPADWPHPEGTTWEKEGDVRFLRFQSAKPGQMVLVYRQVTLPTPLPPALEVRLRVRYA